MIFEPTGSDLDKAKDMADYYRKQYIDTRIRLAKANTKVSILNDQVSKLNGIIAGYKREFDQG